MQLGRLIVTNFRAARSTSLSFENLTAILGENNSGKSALVKALDLFFSNAPKVDDIDFHEKNFAEPIHITVHFKSLTPAERAEFGGNLVDGELIVSRTLLYGNPKQSGMFSVDALVNPKFTPLRDENLGKTEKRTLYNELREEIPELPAVRNADQIDEYLEAWEDEHPDDLVRERVGGFKGFKNVAVGKLKAHTDFIFVPAVSHVSMDLHEDKNSPVRELLNTIARQALENKIAFQEFKERTSGEIAELTNPANVPELAELNRAASVILKKYYRESEIEATWKPLTDVPISFPTATMMVKDHSFVSDIDRVGHGLQRAVFLSVLEYVARNRNAGVPDEEQGQFGEAQSDIIIAIEEPEIYQHPTKQRLFAQVFTELVQAFSASTGIRIQILYVTHSPLLVEISRCQEIRIARRVRQNDEQNIGVTSVSLQRLATLTGERKQLPKEKHFSAERYGATLHIFTPDIAEGFFAKCCVLVEGVSDCAILEACYLLQKRNPLAEGIVIKSTEGKTKLDKPLSVFRELSIPTYLVFDNDKAKNKEESKSYNKLLQSICDVSDGELEEWPDGVNDEFAAWDGNVESYVKSVVGVDEYAAVLNEFSVYYDVEKADCVKSPSIASGIIKRLMEKGFEFKKFNSVLEKIDKLVDA